MTYFEQSKLTLQIKTAKQRQNLHSYIPNDLSCTHQWSSHRRFDFPDPTAFRFITSYAFRMSCSSASSASSLISSSVSSPTTVPRIQSTTPHGPKFPFPPINKCISVRRAIPPKNNFVGMTVYPEYAKVSSTEINSRYKRYVSIWKRKMMAGAKVGMNLVTR